MKTAEKVILLFEDSDGFAAAISDGVQPNPTSSFQTLKESFDLSLEQYGIKEKVSVNITHFVDSNGAYQVSILLLQKCEPPVLACAVNEAIASIAGENSSSMPTLIIPFLLPEAKLKLDDKISLKNVNATLHGIQIGSDTDAIKALVNRTQKLPSSLKINDEALACSVQLARVMKIPTFLLVGLNGQSKSSKSYEEDLKVSSSSI
ncbi:Period circadian protein [Heracleum sosnowskyi]|uniref:Period circadian protein n=1 Tax=Heracleum sosnowskyi TaxID=360622 RepID=A0AAD8LZ34_9APIA|nr:Period circadian protein [Heracleum sosnowskyi]